MIQYEDILFWLAVLGPSGILGGIVSVLVLKDRWFTNRVVKAQINPLTESNKRSSQSENVVNNSYFPTATELQGEVIFDYSNYDGRYIIGSGVCKFETAWSKASDESIYCYNDPPSISGVALAPKGSRLSDITNASSLNYTSKSRHPEIGQFVILQNSNGFYAAIKILGIKDDTRSDDHDELSFRYWILPDGSGDFSHLTDDEGFPETLIETSPEDLHLPLKPEALSYPLVELEIGTLRSNVANYVVNYETLRFRGKATAEVFLQHAYGSTLQTLYERPDNKYLVYVEQDYRHDYWISSLAGAMVGGESEDPLSVADVQERFPELATKAGLSRITDI